MAVVRKLPFLLLGGVLACACHAEPSPLEGVRHALATDPLRHLPQLEALRKAAGRDGDLLTLLRVDELACRAQADLNLPQALAAAESGLARVAEPPKGPLRDAWLRLRVCRASARLALAQRDTADAELNELVGLAEPGTSSWAIARMERGVGRSRRSDWAGAQDDLVAACDVLQQFEDVRDVEMCLGQLANHYQRVDDVDEALRLMTRLQTTLAARGEDYDASIAAYNLASLYADQQRWDEAVQMARAAESASARLKDRLGQGYANRIIALALMRQDKVTEALARAEQALTQVDRSADAREHGHLVLTHAELLARAGRAAEALPIVELESRRLPEGAEDSLREALARTRAQVMTGLGRWQEAYEAKAAESKLAEARHRQRMSNQAARLGMQFNRARDAKELAMLRQLHERERELQRTQAVALALFGILLLAVGALVVRKIRQVRQLQRLATTDELTGLLNRRAMLAQAERVARQTRRDGTGMALLMMDIDHFKRINDGHGHPAGDAVLRQVARVLGETLRAADRLGRIGGEEFVALLHGADADDVQAVAERMRTAVEQAPIDWQGSSLHFTISMGWALRSTDESVESLLARADAALYRAKAGGRNRVAA